MKKYIIILAALVLMTSCATVKTAQRVVTEAFIDYRTFSNSGFLLSPDPYPSEFEAVGELYVWVVPAMKGQYTSSIYGANAETTSRYVVSMENISYQELAGIAVAKAKRLGADALVNFDIQRVNRYPTRKMKNWATSEYIITGFCIVRK